MAIFQYNQERLYRKDPDLHLLYWGKEACKPGHTVGPGVRDLYKIHFIHKGKGLVRIGSQTHHLTPGQGFLIYPDVISYYEADQEEPWTYSWIGFRGAQVESILARTRLTPEQAVFPMDRQVMPHMYEQLTEANAHAFSADLKLKVIIYEFMAVLLEVAPASSSGEEVRPNKWDSYLIQSMEFIHAHYNEPFSIEDLASLLKLDRKYFSAIFKEATGLPPQQYLLQYRMNKACELLEKSNYAIGEIANSVGYQDQLIFSKMFKRVKGVSPKLFRHMK
ncbi:AraC family transcriptional regulator [Paenibacillus pectinilyticus]|uniref:AraC family transcriptional regulator n=1 Tax=Paenibacillus pectinilyticus TaxID=512399 RepID=A0A1C1A4B5_9BACL|nr:AraC family transcriptional regulator [Paenibacillus pectinilyticus]OCT15376.1 AraC family transcriptional regulator [Paenibacillus pectinilyticus]